MENKINTLKKELQELSVVIELHNNKMEDFRNENKEYKQHETYKEMQKQQCRNATTRHELEKELKALEKEYAISTLENKYKEKFDSVLLITKGKYAGEIHELNSFGRIYRRSGHGRYSETIKNKESEKVLELLKELNVNVTFGNDAPRGGKLGEFYQINTKTKFWNQYKKYEMSMSKF